MGPSQDGKLFQVAVPALIVRAERGTTKREKDQFSEYNVYYNGYIIGKEVVSSTRDVFASSELC